MVDGPELTQIDFEAADAVLARMEAAPSVEVQPRDKLRNLYASLHARFGADKFTLRFGLREPRTPLEELEFLLFNKQITESEYRKRAKEYVTRPVDLPMLQKFFSEYELAVQEYGDVLKLIVQIATDQRKSNDWSNREQQIDAAVAILDGKFDLSNNELVTVCEFLTQVQADREEPIKCGDYLGDSAHWIAALAFSDTSEMWKRCKEIAWHSRKDPDYLYPTNASSLFFKTLIASNKLPRPNDLAALMRSERAKALSKFHERKPMSRPPISKLAKTVQPVHFEDFSGLQFERLVFAYHWRTGKWRTLDWYGQSGSDLGRDIWGVRENGQSLCIQCANRKKIPATKITRDLDNIVRAPSGIPNSVLVVCQSSVSAHFRDKVKAHARSKGIELCDIWSGHEFEERLRLDAENLLKRFIDGVEFPDDPQELRSFINSNAISDDVVMQRIIQRFDRPAFETPFHQECSLPDFRKAIDDTIQGLNTGIWQTRDGKEIERLPSRHDLADRHLRDELAAIVRDLTALRSQFVDFLRNGEIRQCTCGQPDCPTFFCSPMAAEQMNARRAAIISRVNGLRCAGPPSRGV
jgi:hypothetical protein